MENKETIMGEKIKHEHTVIEHKNRQTFIMPNSTIHCIQVRYKLFEEELELLLNAYKC